MLKSFILATFFKLYPKIPLKVLWLKMGKRLGLNNHPIYKDLKFQGDFNLHIPGGKRMRWRHFGGQIENELFWQGAWKTFEPEMGPSWLALAKNANIILDVGANTGLYALAAEAVNPHARIFAFEPSVKTYNKLKHQIKINNSHVTAVQTAISNQNGQALFYDLIEENQTGASLAAEKYKNSPEYQKYVHEYSVKTQKGDDFIIEMDLTQVDLIKIDVEMHEAEVVEGFITTLKQHQPVVFIEVLTQEVANALNPLFGQANYRFFLLHQDQSTTEFHKLICQDGKWNWLAIPVQKLENTLYTLHEFNFANSC